MKAGRGWRTVAEARLKSRSLTPNHHQLLLPVARASSEGPRTARRRPMGNYLDTVLTPRKFVTKRL